MRYKPKEDKPRREEYGRHWITLRDQDRRDLILITNLLNVSISSFIRSSVKVALMVLKDEMFTTETMMEEFIRWRDSLHNPETAKDYEKILQQRLMNENRTSFREILLADANTKDYRRGRPRKK